MELGGDWNDAEISAFARRQVRLEKMCLPLVEAEKLAQTLLYRDRPDSGDDRKLCLECAHFVEGRCKKGRAALPFILQRCDKFLKVGR